MARWSGLECTNQQLSLNYLKAVIIYVFLQSTLCLNLGVNNRNGITRVAKVSPEQNLTPQEIYYDKMQPRIVQNTIKCNLGSCKIHTRIVP